MVGYFNVRFLHIIHIYHWVWQWKRIWTSVNIWWSYAQQFSVLFFLIHSVLPTKCVNRLSANDYTLRAETVWNGRSQSLHVMTFTTRQAGSSRPIKDILLLTGRLKMHHLKRWTKSKKKVTKKWVTFILLRLCLTDILTLSVWLILLRLSLSFF